MFNPSSPVPTIANRHNTPWRILSAKFSPDALSITPLVVLLLLGYLLLWSGLTGISHRAPDLDNMEQLVWGNIFEWGYYKHPPLPSWLLFGLTSLFGRQVWLTFFAGQLSVVLSLWFIWRLGCEMTSQKNALIATLVVTPITYFTVRGVISNHNTLQLCSIAACLWTFYRAWRYERMRDWLVLGFCCGLAMLTKYSALVQFAVFFLFLLFSGNLRQTRTWKGIAIAGGVFLMMLAPHILWLSQQSKNPASYAMVSIWRETTRLESLHMVSDTLGTTLARLAPMLIGLIIIVLLVAKGKERKPSLPQSYETLAHGLRPADRFFILFVGLGPFVLTLVTVLVLKARLIADWTTTFYLLFGFLAFWLLHRDPGTRLLRICLQVIVSMQIVMALGYAIARGPLSDMTGRPTRATFPGAAVSAQLQAQWNSHERTPLTLIAADTWLGGNIAIHAGHSVNVLIDGDLDKSQWVTPKQAASCGMLVALNRSPDATDGIPPKVVKLMSKAIFRGIIKLPWTKKIPTPEVVVEWGIIPPLLSCSEIRYEPIGK